MIMLINMYKYVKLLSFKLNNYIQYLLYECSRMYLYIFIHIYTYLYIFINIYTYLYAFIGMFKFVMPNNNFVMFWSQTIMAF